MQLCAQHRFLDKDIVCMDRDAIWNAGQLVDQPCHQGRMSGIVSVNVIDACFLEMIGHPDGTWKQEQGPRQKLRAAAVFADHFPQ